MSRKVEKFYLQIFTMMLGVLLIGQIVFAQNQTKAPDRGFSPGKSYSMSGIETISMQSGNLMLNVPLGSLPAGRGGMSAGIGLHYNSKLWDSKDGEVPNQQGVEYPSTALNVNIKDGGWRYGYLHRIECDINNGENGHDYFSSIIMPDGGRHQLWLAGYTDGYGGALYRPDGTYRSSGGWTQGLTGTITFFTTDGTFLRLDVTTDSDTDYTNNKWVLYSPDGSRVVHDPAIGGGVAERIYDRNGNFIDIIETASDSNYSNRKTTYIKDELGRKVVIEYNAATNAGMSQDFIHSPGSNGVDVITKVEWKTITVHKHYHMADVNIPNQMDFTNRPIDQNFLVVNKIYIPTPDNGSFNYNLNYSFDYNANATSNPSIGWGEVSKVTLPSGASSSYEYQLDNVTANQSAYFITANRSIKKTLEYNLENDGSVTPTSEVWNYAVQYQDNNLEILSNTTITGPDGGVTREEYRRFSTGTEYDTEAVKNVSPDGTEIEKFYESNVPTESSYLGVKANRFPKYEYVSIKNAAGVLTKTAIKEYSRDKNGNVTEVKEYDWVTYSSVPRDSDGRPNGLPSGATPARISKTEYYNETPDSASTTYTDADSYYLSSNPRLLNLAKSSEVQTGAGTPKTRSEMTYDYTSYSSNTKGGNLTESKTWDSFKGGSTQAYSNPLTTSNSVSSTVQYDTYGNPTLTIDAKGNQTQITYGAINGHSGLYPTEVKSAYNTSIEQTVQSEYDFYTGITKKTTALGNTTGENVISETEYDALGRPLKVKSGVGTSLEIWSTTEYNDTLRRVIVRSDIETKGDGKKIAVQHFDQLGRVRLTRQIENVATEDPTNEADGIKVQTRYQTGNPYSYQLSSNPYRAATSTAATNEESMGWTRSKSINTGKHSEVETFTGATLPAPWGSNTTSTGKVQTDIDAERTLVTNQSGKQRISKTNALGQLLNVWEVKTADSDTEAITFGTLSLNGLKTSYQYDPLNNLTTVNQGSQTRSFSYSSLSRLLTATNPESGTIGYVYDNNGNLTNKTDARSVLTTYTYDALNRVLTRSYSNEPSGQTAMPNVTYTYDNLTNAKGKLIKVDNGFSKTEYTQFDLLGRVTKSKQTTDNTAYNEMLYSYNLSGALIEETYPSLRVVKNTFDNDGELAQVQSKKVNDTFRNYANSFNYTAAGAVSSMRLGNGLWENTSFNSRLQPIQIGLGSGATSQNLLKLNYDYGSTANNGNIQSQTITVPTVGSNAGFTATQTYTYDSLNRLKDAKEMVGTTETWKQTFTFDRYGNRNFDEANTTTLPKNCGTSPNFTVCAADKKIYNPAIDTSNNNRLSTSDGYTFDAAGNTTKDAQSRKFTYDGENKQIKVETVNSGGTVTGTLGEYFYDGDGKRVKKVSATETTIFIYDASGKMVAEYSTQLATTPQISYLTTDQLGSPRINTDATGAVTARHDYQPFGEEIARASYGADTVRKQFTGYERDDETDLDFAEARYYKSQHGRFTSADPISVTQERIIFPQMLNLYVYAIDNPLRFTDPTGMDVNTDRLNESQLDMWNRVMEIVNAQDEDGNYLNPELKALYDKLDSNERIFYIQGEALGAGSAGLFEIEQFNGENDFSTATITLDFEKIEKANVADALFGDFKQFDGLSNKNEKRAEVAGHEFKHAADALDNTAEVVKGQRIVQAYKKAALEANRTRTPFPPDIEKTEGERDAFLEKGERSAYAAEKRINKEINNSRKKREQMEKIMKKKKL